MNWYYNNSTPKSTLEQKNQSIAYHLVREGVSREGWRNVHANVYDNEDDFLTKVLHSGEKRKGFVRRVLRHVCDDM